MEVKRSWGGLQPAPPFDIGRQRVLKDRLSPARRRMKYRALRPQSSEQGLFDESLDGLVPSADG
jgi:hypothetical protein